MILLKHDQGISPAPLQVIQAILRADYRKPLGTDGLDQAGGDGLGLLLLLLNEDR